MTSSTAFETLRSNLRQQYLSTLQAEANADLQDTLVVASQQELILAQAREIVGSGTQLPEGFLYMAYAAAAVYDADVAIEGGFEPYGHPIAAAPGASADAAIVEAAYRTLWAYFPPEVCNPASPPAAYAFCLGVRPRLDALYAEALAAIPPGQARTDGQAVGLQAANDIIAVRGGDGRMTPISVTSSFPTLPPGPGVWRLTPPFLAPQTPWLANVRPWVLQRLDQFLPGPPPSLQSHEWADAFNQIRPTARRVAACGTTSKPRSLSSGRRTRSASTTGWHARSRPRAASV